MARVPHLSSIPALTFKKPSVMVDIGGPSSGKAETGCSWGSLASQPSLLGEFQARKRSCVKKNKWTAPEKQ